MALSTSDLQKLEQVDLRLVLLCKYVAKHVAFRVLTGHRGEEEQNKAFAEGKSKLRWPNGNHNSLPSKAIDVVPVYFDKGVQIDWEDKSAIARLIGWFECAAADRGIQLRVGMDWDGDWRTVDRDPSESFLDMFHIEVLN